MKKLIRLLTHFAAHLQGKKPSLAKELQTHAATSSRIAINFLQNIINRPKINNQSPPTTQFFYSKKISRLSNQLILASEHPPSCTTIQYLNNLKNKK